MTAKENKKIANDALIGKIESEIDKAAREGSLYYKYDDTLSKNIIYHFLTLGYRIYITLAAESATVFDWSNDENGIYLRPNVFADYRNVDIEEI